MVGDILVNGSSIFGELSLGSVLGEEFEFWVRRFWRLIHCVVRGMHSKHDSWSD